MAVAQKLAGEGYRVAGTTTSEGSATIAEALGDGNLGVVMDVRSEDSYSGLAVVEEALGTPTIVVIVPGSPRTTSCCAGAEQWSSVMDTNTNGLYE